MGVIFILFAIVLLYLGASCIGRLFFDDWVEGFKAAAFVVGGTVGLVVIVIIFLAGVSALGGNVG